MLLEDWGLRLFLAGMGLGMSLMTFVVTFDGTPFYQELVAPTMTGTMYPLGYVLDAGVLLSLGMTVSGIACFRGRPLPGPAPATETRKSAAEQLAAYRRRKEERARQARRSQKRRGPTPVHGST